MVRKKMEGNEEQRRKAAREARAAGTTPSARNATTGASKQPHTLPKHDPHHHVQRLDSIHRGKQQDESPSPKPGYGEPASKRRRES
ncbi:MULTISPECIES: hypothetical protein [Actinomadura]|uniref:DUF5302 domain-containing protein n=1 Tax=Actinomadura yumaensis TaxID=111807 RepID=A0ABW2CMJ5_9ACTN|nr:hypothetical protein [Actinomadura sp. J1-007]MWK37838.1 hypothetical protein [Actinomadura sp. J1-007]